MPALSDYVTGTITLTNGSAAFTGNATGWLLAGFKEGDTILDVAGASGRVGVISSITSNTAGTLSKAWEGPTLTNVAYRMRYHPDGARVSAQARNLIEVLGNGNLQSLSGLEGSADRILVFTGPGTMALIPRTDIASGYTQVSKFGTIGDGATDDTGAIQSALAAADTGKGKALLLTPPTTNYRIATGLTLSGTFPVTLIGDGQPEIRSEVAGTALTIGSGPTVHQGFIDLRDFKLWAPTGGGGTIRGIKGNYLGNLSMSGLSLYRLGVIGAYLDNCYAFRMDRCLINDCGVAGLYLTGASMNGSVISRSKFFYHTDVDDCAISIDGAASFHFGGHIDECDIEFNYVGIKINDISGLTISNSYFEENTRHIWAPGASNVDTLKIENCQFVGPGQVILNDVDGLVLDNLVFYGTGEVLTLNNCTNVKWGRIYLPNGGTIGGTNVRKYDFQMFPEWRDYTPTWGSLGTAPALGNGTIEAKYMRVGNTCQVRMTLTMGSTSTFGTVGWTFSLPFPARNITNAKWLGKAAYRDASVPAAANNLTSQVYGNESIVYVFTDAGVIVSNANPITWATGDQLWLHFEYETE